ncbi:MAG: VWA domain-containing protein [Acidobacteria bacterium]|nr:VWA domain-containing protein [Acidobacteriota bacterium]
MRYLPLPLLLSLPLAAFLVAAPSSRAQQQGPPRPADPEAEEVVRVNTMLVTVPVSVTDRQGRFIPGLRKEQFRIFEDGAEQEIAHFESADKPFTVALLLDMSDSTKYKREDIQAAAKAFVDKLRPEDRVILVAFDKNVALLTGVTSDRQVLYEAIGRARTGGGTSVYDAVELVISRHLSRIPGRKAIVLFTDGVDTTSRATYLSTLRAAEELDALAYAVQYNTIDDAAKGAQSYALATTQLLVDAMTSKGEPLSSAYKRANLFLRLLTDKTGGRFYYADTVKNLSESFARIAEELRRQYSISYYPKNQSPEGGGRRIRVRVDVPGAAVRARKSYIFRPAAKKRERAPKRWEVARISISR